MKEVKPFASAGGYTVFSNTILDLIMRRCTPTEWLIICAVMRKTTGWNKPTDDISISQLMELTGLSKQTVITAAKRAVEDGYITRDGNGIRKMPTYSINRDYTLKINAGSKSEPESKPSLEIRQAASLEIRQEIVKDLDIQNTSLNKLNTSAEKIRAVCNASPAWAIAHGETPTQITDEQRERDSINQFPQQYRGFAEAYILGTKRLATKNEIGRWSKAFREMSERGVTPEILTATIREMRNKGLTITWPGSCTYMAAAKAAGRKRVEVETPEPLEDIFARPAYIPETRWRKATQ